MPNFQDLPSPEKMQRVVRIQLMREEVPNSHYVIMFALDEHCQLVQLHSTFEHGFKLPCVDVFDVRYLVIPLMQGVTGKQFRLSEDSMRRTVWLREDYQPSKEQDT